MKPGRTQEVLSVEANLGLPGLSAERGRSQKNFFETRVIEYQTGGAPS